MKRLASLLTLGFLSFNLVACGSQNQTNLLSTPVAQSASTGEQAEKPITKQETDVAALPALSDDFSKFAATKNEESYNPDPKFEETSKTNYRRRGYLPYDSYSQLESDIRYDNYTDYKYSDSRTARMVFDKNYSNYEYAKDIYRASTYEMKRFIKLDVLVNSLEVDGRVVSYRETHNPPYRPGWKLLPTDAAKVMPSFGEIVDYNRYGSDSPYVRWNDRRAAEFYYRNYDRWMGMIMEFGPTERKAHRLIHREISEYASRY